MTQIAFIGGGNMGFALASGVKRKLPQHTIKVADPIAAQRARFDAEGMEATSSNTEAAADSEVLVLAVKPQVIEEVATGLRSVISDQLVISIVAGTPLVKLNSLLGENVAIVRCMPNTPALVGEGITGLLANTHTTPSHRELTESILGVCGQYLWFKSDDELDMVTALSGSGPAYFFYLIEALINAGEELGLSREATTQLVVQTAIGASAMAAQSESSPSELRENVTSPGGTTEAAIQRLREHQADKSIVEAVQSAYRRAQELAK